MRICLEQSAFPGVIRVTEKVAHDVELVSGKKPQILVEKEIPETLESSGEDWTIIAATKGKSSFLKKLEEAGSAEFRLPESIAGTGAGTKERMLCMDFS